MEEQAQAGAVARPAYPPRLPDAPFQPSLSIHCFAVHCSQAFPDPSAYSAFMGSFSSATGVATLAMMLFGRFVFRKWGWGTAAMITPAVLLGASLAWGAVNSVSPHLSL